MGQSRQLDFSDGVSCPSPSGTPDTAELRTVVDDLRHGFRIVQLDLEAEPAHRVRQQLQLQVVRIAVADRLYQQQGMTGSIIQATTTLRHSAREKKKDRKYLICLLFHATRSGNWLCFPSLRGQSVSRFWRRGPGQRGGRGTPSRGRPLRRTRTRFTRYECAGR